MPVHQHPDGDMASPMIISDSSDHVVIAIEISKESLRLHARFIEQLATLASRED
jgi:hypothetical protein